MLVTPKILLETSNTRVLPLGNHQAIDKTALLGFMRTPKDINNTNAWATLGWRDDMPFPTGFDIQFSVKGNDDSAKAATLDEIKKLYAVYPEINKKHPVLERYIDLNDLPKADAASSDPKNPKELRLDIHVAKNEGALVFVQHSAKNNYNDLDAFVQYVRPEPTNGNRYDNRNKLTFHIPFIHTKVENQQLVNGTDEKDNEPDIVSLSFIIKVLTFVRNAKTPQEAIKTFATSLKDPLIGAATDNLGKSNYAIRKFDATMPLKEWNNCLVDITQSTDKIDFSAKTLLLIHGTFKDSYGTFELLVKSKYKKTEHNFLNHLIKAGHFEQILAFDHPYFWDTTQENIEWLLTNVLKNNSFSNNKLNMLAASRGGLLAYHMASSPANDLLKVNKIMCFSSGSSGYISTLEGLDKMLSFLKIGAPLVTQKLIVGLVSTGLNFLHDKSGLNILKPKNPELDTIYKGPLAPNVEVKIMAADWHKSLINKNKKWKRILFRGVASIGDYVIRAFLGPQHDWVIGTENQREYKVINKNNINITEIEYRCTHGKYFNINFPRTMDNKHIDIHSEIEQFFKF